jgi:hypothetical protein
MLMPDIVAHGEEIAFQREDGATETDCPPGGDEASAEFRGLPRGDCQALPNPEFVCVAGFYSDAGPRVKVRRGTIMILAKG